MESGGRIERNKNEDRRGKKNNWIDKVETQWWKELTERIRSDHIRFRTEVFIIKIETPSIIWCSIIFKYVRKRIRKENNWIHQTKLILIKKWA